MSCSHWKSILAPALAALLLTAAPRATAQDNPVLVGRVTKVTDGDTLKVQLSSGPITVRLDSADAPEKYQPWGKQARSALAKRLSGREVDLEVKEHDRYDRLVAVVYLGDENINAWMVEQGHAWAYREHLQDRDYCWRGWRRWCHRRACT